MGMYELVSYGSLENKRWIIYCCMYLQAHNDFFAGKKHEVISMTAYKTFPGRYKKMLCEQHEEKLIMACTNCMKCVCEKCNIRNIDCKGK